MPIERITISPIVMRAAQRDWPHLEDSGNSLVTVRHLTEELPDLRFSDPVGQGASMVCTLVPMLGRPRGVLHVSLNLACEPLNLWSWPWP